MMRTTRRRGQRPGFALAITLLAMTVLGALAAGMFVLTLREFRDARDALNRARALGAAEFGLYATQSPASWNALWNATPARGLLATRAFNPGDGSRDTVRVWKLAPADFFVTSDGRSGASATQARRRVGLLFTLHAPHLVPSAAAVVRDDAVVAGDSHVSGADSTAMGWDCAPPASNLPALRIADRNSVDTTACGASPCLSGDPPIAEDSMAATAEVYEQFGTFTRAQLAGLGLLLPAGAEIVNPAPALDAAGACDAANPANLGDPLRIMGASSPCANHFPLRYAPASLHLSGGAGQGTLVVDGNLLMDNAARFFGVLLVRGELHLTGAAHFTGVAFASRLTVDSGAVLQLSRCATARAFLALGTPTQPPGPAWIEIH